MIGATATVVVVIVPSLLFVLLFALGSQRTIFERSTSPDRRHEARVQFDDAGAVSSFARMVFVKSRWNPSDSPSQSCRAFWGHGENAVHLSWPDNRTLLIRHEFPAGEVRAVADRCGPVQIIVQPAPH